MKNRRGSSLWGETDGLSSMIYRFEVGDLVTPVTSQQAHFLGVVKEVLPKLNKVMVLWNGGSLKQHDPDEIMLEPYQSEIVRTRMASSRRVKGKAAEKIASVERTSAKRQIVKFDWNDERSIKDGERKKWRLENNGYTLVQTNGGLSTSELIYELKEKSASVNFNLAESVDCGCQKLSADGFATGPQFVGDPETHGIDKPRGGGFSIMQDLQKDLHKEMKEQADIHPKIAEIEFTEEEGPRVASEKTAARFRPGDKIVFTGGGINDGKKGVVVDMSKIPTDGRGIPRVNMGHYKPISHDDVAVQYDDGQLDVVNSRHITKQGAPGSDYFNIRSGNLKSRRAMYWGAPDRVYRLTKEEQEAGNALCPKCRCNMNLEPFTKSEKLYTCESCGFKVPTSKTTTTRITIDVDKGTGEVDVDVTTAKSRRGNLRSIEE